MHQRSACSRVSVVTARLSPIELMRLRVELLAGHGSDAPGHSTIGGYEIGPILSTNGSTGSRVINYAFTGRDRFVIVNFIAGKYQHDARWSAAVGYYYYDQKSYGLGVNSIPRIVASWIREATLPSFTMSMTEANRKS